MQFYVFFSLHQVYFSVNCGNGATDTKIKLTLKNKFHLMKTS